jgi:hypothetical protein
MEYDGERALTQHCTERESLPIKRNLIALRKG